IYFYQLTKSPKSASLFQGQLKYSCTQRLKNLSAFRVQFKSGAQEAISRVCPVALWGTTQLKNRDIADLRDALERP
ncbi:unnamed protein product, partial [Oikopleura dioica]